MVFHFARAEHRLAWESSLNTPARRETMSRRNCWGAFPRVLAVAISESLLPHPPGAAWRAAYPAHRTIGGSAFDPYAMMLTYLALTLANLGYIDQARSRLDEALLEARQHERINEAGFCIGCRAICSTPPRQI
jgi:hypothetical protein